MQILTNVYSTCLPQHRCSCNFSHCSHTWKTFGAEIRLASADDKVADTIPAIIIGPNADATCIT